MGESLWIYRCYEAGVLERLLELAIEKGVDGSQKNVIDCSKVSQVIA